MTRGILLGIFVCAAIILHAQQSITGTRVNEVFNKIPLSRALKTIQENYNVKIAYDHALVQNVIVALRLNDLSIQQSIERLLENTSLTFSNVGDNIVVVPRSPDLDPVIEKKNIQLSGNVIDVDSEETLPQATIKVIGTHIITTTNNDGYFSVLNIPSDTCVLEVSYMGFITARMRVKEINNADRFSIKLKSDTKILNEVVVLDEHNQAVQVEEQSGSLVFNPRSLNNLPSLGEQDIFRTMQLIPGVTATDESSSGMVIRGMHSSYNLTLLDGMTIYQQDHFFGTFSIINSDIIKDVRVHKGMFDAKYGGRVSGVVDITTKNGNAVKPAFNVRLNAINAKATAEIPISKKWSLFTGARRSFTDILQSNLFNTLFDIARTSNDQIQIFKFTEDTGQDIKPKYQFFDTNTKLTFRPATRDIFALSLYISRDKMLINKNASFGEGSEVYTIDDREATRWGNNGASLRWGRQWTKNYYTNIRISNSRFFREYDYDQNITFDAMHSKYMLGFENSISDLSYSIDNEWMLSNTLSVEFGLSGIRQHANAHVYFQDDVSGDTPPEETPDNTDMSQDDGSWLHSLYGSLHTSLTDRLTTIAGVRIVNYYNQESEQYIEPRLSAYYKITEHLNLKGGYGRNNQFITQLFYYSPSGTMSAINENFWMLSQPHGNGFQVISSDHLSTGATLKSKQFAYDAELYYKVSTGVIIDENLNSGNTDMYGLDLMIQKTSGIHKGWIAYSLAKATQTHPYILNGQAAPSWQDQRHELKVVDMLTLGDWNFSSTLIYGSGKPYPKYTVKYFRDENGTINSYNLILDYSNQSRLPSYFRVDVSVAYKFSLKGIFNIETGLSVYNLLDHKNIKTRRIDTDGLNRALNTTTELPANYNDVVLLGFSPTLFLNFSF